MPAQAGDTPSISPAALEKASLRREARQRRRALPPKHRRDAAQIAVRYLLDVLPSRCRIAIYLSIHSEIATGPLLDALRLDGHRVYAPLMQRERRMRFVPIDSASALRRGALGILQPVSRRGLRTARRLDVIIIPLLAFDARGGRLGNGGGYYDRALAGSRIGRRPALIGYAFAAQEIDAIPLEAFDVRLDAVVTERGLRRFDRPPTPTQP